MVSSILDRRNTIGFKHFRPSMAMIFRLPNLYLFIEFLKKVYFDVQMKLDGFIDYLNFKKNRESDHEEAQLV